MSIKEYVFRSKSNPSITEDTFHYLDSTVVDDIIYNKEKIQEVLVAPTCHIINSDLDFLTKVSVRHYGVVFDVIKRGLGDKYTTEYGKVYFFNSGEVHLVYEGLDSLEYGSVYREDDLIELLDNKMDFEYKLLSEKMFIEEIFAKTKPKNREIMRECKEHIGTVLDEARKQLDDEILNEDEGINSPIKESHTRINTLVYKL